MNHIALIPWVILWLTAGLAVSLLVASIFEEAKGVVTFVFRLVATPAVIVGQAALQGIFALGRTIDDLVEGLGYRTKYNEHADTRSPVWRVIGPLIYLALITPLLIVEFIIGSMRIGAVIGFPVMVSSGLDTLAGAAWVLTAATWGAIVLDSIGITPVTRPWHNASPHARKVIVVLSITAIVLTALTGGMLYLIGELNKQGHPQPMLEDTFVFMFAVLLLGATAMAGWALFAGSAAVFAVGLMIVRLIARVVFILAKMVAKVVDAGKNAVVAALACMGTPGRRIWNWIADSNWGRRRNLRPIAPFTAPDPIDSDLAEEAIPPAHTDLRSAAKEVIAMKHYIRTPRSTGVIAVGNGVVYAQAMAAAAASSGAVEDILFYGALDTHAPGTPRPVFYPPYGIPNLTATVDEVRAIRAMSPDDSAMELGLSRLLADSVVDVCRSANIADPHIIVAWDGRGTQNHEAGVVQTLIERVKSLLPEAHVTVLVILPDMARRDQRLTDGLDMLADRKVEGQVGGVIVLDPQSPFAAAHGIEKLADGVAAAVCACIIAHLHDRHSPTAAETLSLLFRDATFAGVRLWSNPVTMGSTPGGVSRSATRRLPEPDDGQLADVVSVGKATTAAALGDPLAAGVRQAINTSEPFLIVSAVPLRESDPRFAAYVRQARAQAATSDEMAVPVFAGFAGVPLHETDNGLQLTVAAVFPLHAPVAGVASKRSGSSTDDATPVGTASEARPTSMQH